MDRSLTGIGLDLNLPHLLLLFTIFEHMCLDNFYTDSNPHLNAAQHMVYKVLSRYRLE